MVANYANNTIWEIVWEIVEIRRMELVLKSGKYKKGKYKKGKYKSLFTNSSLSMSRYNAYPAAKAQLIPSIGVRKHHHKLRYNFSKVFQNSLTLQKHSRHVSRDCNIDVKTKEISI